MDNLFDSDCIVYIQYTCELIYIKLQAKMHQPHFYLSGEISVIAFQ